MEKKQREYWLWLCLEKSLYRSHLHQLMRVFQKPENVFGAPEGEIRQCGFLSAIQMNRLLSSRACWDYQKEAGSLKDRGISFVSVEDEGYPRRLKKIPDYPYGLFYKGELPGEEKPAVAIIGARKCSSYGKTMAEKIAGELAEGGIQIISGMAYGIDGVSQGTALERGGYSCGVTGCGVDICYPKANKGLYARLVETGGIVSEYPPGREPLAHHFPIRNRIISGLSDVLIVIEAKEKSGTSITTDLALEQGKDVYALPGRIGDELSSGCNRLIAQGAGVFLSVEEFLQACGIPYIESKTNIKNKIVLETQEILVYSGLSLMPRTLQDIIEETKLPAWQVMKILTGLELKGLIREPMKNNYVRNN